MFWAKKAVMCSPIPIARSIMISRRFSTFECWRCQEVETTIDGDDSGWEVEGREEGPGAARTD